MTDSPWFVYLLECADGTYYCGVTTDLDRRLTAHNAGAGAKYTRSRTPVRAVACCPCADKGAALRLEMAIKKLPRNKKPAALKLAAEEEATCRS
ncbi:GIY-YIG nuclease family protein [Paucidesulfovibrio longus]|uniref:GIY-YIG nuclease family protein n=1 Tax=Paucidesulfovibrio longus TaxID=889 RepID=UPI0003B64A0E|nr:GIY-YIG nuclease family protein [Paucidesulfovibrio longus]